MTIPPVGGSPTTQLPPIGKIRQTSLTELQVAISYLGSLYNPEVRLNRRSYRRSGTPRCLSQSHDTVALRRGTSDAASVLHPCLDGFRADGFEKSYAIRWLTALVVRADELEADQHDVVDAESIVQDAASLLAICAGTASAGTRSRMFTFDHAEGEVPAAGIKVRLTDLPLDNQDYASLGAQTWGGACLMADLIVQSPSEFAIGSVPGRPLRVLELGAGTGLVGITVGKVLELRGTIAETIMTDFHPAVLENLRKNVTKNFGAPDSTVQMSVHPLDWSKVASSCSQQLEGPFDRPFDLILGADIVYELEHARWIKSCVEKLLRVPPAEGMGALISSSLSPPNPEFHLVMPQRSTHAAGSQTVEEVFPSASFVRDGTESPPEGGKVQRTLAIIAKEVVMCEDFARGSDNEVEYVHFTIVWV